MAPWALRREDGDLRRRPGDVRAVWQPAQRNAARQTPRHRCRTSPATPSQGRTLPHPSSPYHGTAASTPLTLCYQRIPLPNRCGTREAGDGRTAPPTKPRGLALRGGRVRSGRSVRGTTLSSIARSKKGENGERRPPRPHRGRRRSWHRWGQRRPHGQTLLAGSKTTTSARRLRSGRRTVREPRRKGDRGVGTRVFGPGGASCRVDHRRSGPGGVRRRRAAAGPEHPSRVGLGWLQRLGRCARLGESPAPEPFSSRRP